VADAALTAEVAELLFREARLLDAQRWSDWLDLYTEDAVYWVPAFTMAGGHTEHPDTELNFIYMAGRSGLEERVFRLNTGISLSSTPLPRTRHMVGMVMVDRAEGDTVDAFANCQVAVFTEIRGQQLRTSSCEYRLRRTDQGLRIALKKVLLLEAVIDGYFDFYAI
jgi:benzoate/toluate 1,2-dioxygenase beta subunit/2,4,5-trichlorophenoxyacetic acid oxygenase 2